MWLQLLFLVLIVGSCITYFRDSIAYIVAIFHQEKLQNSKIGELNPFSPNKHHTVVVVGGSISGLLAAYTLAKHFKEVIVLEQQKIPEDKCVVPQGEQAHFLLCRGMDIFEKMFPGIVEEWREKWGGLTFDFSEIDTYCGEKKRVEVARGSFNPLKLAGMTRKVIELSLREKIAKIPNILVRDSCKVVGLLFDENCSNRVNGVRIEKETDDEEIIHCNLVVDCSGIGTKTLKWLVEHCTPGAKLKLYTTAVSSKIIYSGVEYKLKGDWLNLRKKSNGIECRALYHLATFPKSKSMVAFQTEGQRAMLLVGNRSQHGGGVRTREEVEDWVSTEGEEMRKTMKSFYEQVIDEGQPFKIFKKDGSVYNHFEKIKVSGFIAMGDAVASFNPVYGQGMTVAAEECLLLDKMLRAIELPVAHERSNFSQRFQTDVCALTTFPWFMSTLFDLRFPETKGGAPWFRRLVVPILSQQLEKVLRLGETDEYIYRIFIEQTHMAYGYKWKAFDPIYNYKLMFSS